MTKTNNTANTKKRRLKNALWGLFIGDALAMPAHWYYNTANVVKDFDGGLRGYADPPHPHPAENKGVASSFLTVSEK